MWTDIKKVAIKLGLDVILIILLSLMYEKQVINLAFHEIGGLCLFGLFFLHLFLNRKWIIAVSKRIFNHSIALKMRLVYLVDILLVAAFALTSIGGVLISKIVFNFSAGGMIWKTIHYSSAALSIILVGIHLGLHIPIILALIKQKINLTASKTIIIIGAAVLLLLGGYNMANSNIINWLSMPFQNSQSGEEHGKGGSSNRGRSNNREGDKTNGNSDRSKPERTQIDGKNSQNHGSGFNFGNLLKVTISYSSIIIALAIVTYVIERLLSGSKKTHNKDLFFKPSLPEM